jgi:phosphoglycolate phosphatase-like HAD superfamily hydrolase
MRNVTQIHAILFDKDGTLVDSNRTWRPAVRSVLKNLARGSAALGGGCGATLIRIILLLGLPGLRLATLRLTTTVWLCTFTR